MKYQVLSDVLKVLAVFNFLIPVVPLVEHIYVWFLLHIQAS